MWNLTMRSRPPNGTVNGTAIGAEAAGPSNARARRLAANLQCSAIVRTASITDHHGADVGIAWKGPADDYHGSQAILFPAYPIHVYTLISANKSPSYEEFAVDFVEWIEQAGNPNWRSSPAGILRPHFEFYGGLYNVLACVDHHRVEVQSRRGSGTWPHLPSDCFDRHGPEASSRFILVVCVDEWKAHREVMFVRFDRPSQDMTRFLDGASRDEKILEAVPIGELARLHHLLTWAFYDAGGVWMQSDLSRRNAGGYSPALYSAVDPLARSDIEVEDTGGAAPVEHNDHDTVEYIPELGISREDLNRQTQHDLFTPAKHIPNLITRAYKSHAELETVSVWKSSLSKTSPSFAVTLYLASDFPPYAAEAIFASLDRDLLAEVPWTLDIIRNVPDLQSAFRHYNHEISHRTPAQCQTRQVCMKMLLQKIAGHTLPAELLQLIEDQLIMPACHDYCSTSAFGYHDKFMYLDASTQQTGPNFVYFNPSQALPEDREQPVLRFTHPNYWTLVSDDIRTDYSTSASRQALPGPDRPYFSIHFESPGSGHRSDLLSDLGFGRETATVSLTLHAKEAITIHSAESSHLFGLFLHAFELVNVETGAAIAASMHPDAATEALAPRKRRTWSQHPLTKYAEPHDAWLGEDPLYTVEPGLVTRVKHNKSFELLALQCPRWHYFADEFWKEGQEYMIRVKPGFSIPRWTYGSLPDLRGPYYLPPIAVYGENVWRSSHRRGDTVTQ